MRCISPISLRDHGVSRTVPCGKCSFCLEGRRADWTFRVMQEAKDHSTAFFMTLTYRDIYSLLPVAVLMRIPVHVVKEHVQLFMKRLRKAIEPVKVRYYLVAEYGTKYGRPHYHLLLFGLPTGLEHSMEKWWPHGNVDVREFNIATAHYTMKYHVNKMDVDDGRAPPFCLMSRRPGIGARYIRTHEKFHKKTKQYYAKVHGIPTRLPRYYKDKFFTALEKRRLADEAVAAGDRDYLETVSKLADFHPDPMAYYDERRAHFNAHFKVKVNKLNIF